MVEVRAQISAGGYVAGRFYIVDETIPAVAGLMKAGYLLVSREVVDGSGHSAGPRRVPRVGVDVGMVGSAWEGTVDGAGEHLPHENVDVHAEENDASGAEDVPSDS